MRKTQVLTMILGTLVLLCSQLLNAATVSVGTCLPAYPHFPTIQAAVNASPQGGTVLVCPGTYPEQVSIFHPLTLKGVDNNGSNLSLITMPPGGTGSQIFVQATGVNISDLTIDGSNNGATACGEGPYGIWYNLSSGVINHVAVRNQYPTGPGLACFDPSGIVVAATATNSANVTIENSAIHGFQGEGIQAFGVGANVTIKNNSIGGVATGAGSNGVAIYFGASGTISNNSIVNINEPVSFPNLNGAGFGILIECSQGVIISGNTIGDTQVGVDVQSSSACTTGNGDANTITNNKISQTHIFDAVYVCGNYNLVQSNTINGTSEAAIRLDGTCNPGVSGINNNFSKNTVNEACTTSLVDPSLSGANTIGSNTTFNVSFDNLSGTVLAAGFCSSAGAPQIARRGTTVMPTSRRWLVPPTSPR